MRKIKLFLASSIDDLSLDRIQVGDFIRQLNEMYIDKGIFFSLIKCEDYDNALAVDGKQSQYDDEIRDSDMVFFLFYSKVGEYTRHEFEVALESYQALNKPKIFTYFKYVNSVDDINSDVKSFMDMLDNEVKHYYNTYNNIDKLKFDMSMQITQTVLRKSDVAVENGRVRVNGVDIAASSDIPIFAGNEELQNMKRELDKLNSRYNELLKSYEKEQSDKELKQRLAEAEQQKKQAAEKVNAKEKKVLALAENIAGTSTKKLTSRLRKSNRLLGQGDYNGALEALNYDEILRDIEENKKCNNKNAIMQNVKELRQRIELLFAMGITNKRSKDIKRTYETISRLTEEYKLDKWIFYDYAQFVFNRGSYDEAINLINRFMKHFKNPQNDKDKERAAWFNHLLGRVHDAAGHREDAADTLLASLKNRKKLAAQKPSDNGRQKALADSYQNLADAHTKDGKYEEAEKEYLEAIKIQKKLARAYWAYNHNLGICTSNLGNLYLYMKRYAEAEQMYKNAIAAADRFNKGQAKQHKKNDLPAGYKDMADTYRNLGYLYKDINRIADAEEAYKKAIEIYENISKERFLTYGPNVADTYWRLANIYSNDSKKSNEAVDACKKSIEVYEKLNAEDPHKYDSDLSYIYNFLGIRYNHDKKYGEAEEYYKKAIKIKERLNKTKPSENESELADFYDNLGALYRDTEKYDAAIEVYTKAAKIYDKLSKGNFKDFGPNLADTYFHLALMYHNTKKASEATDLYKKSAKIFETLDKKASGKYDFQLASIYYLIGGLYYGAKKYCESEEMLKKAIEKKERLYKINPSENEIHLESCYRDLGMLYSNIKKYTEAIEAYKKAVVIKENLNEADPSTHEQGLTDLYGNLSDLYGKLKRYAEQGEACKRAVELLTRPGRKLTTQEEVKLSTFYNNIGFSCYKSKNYPDAEKMYTMSLECFEALNKASGGKYDASVQTIRKNLETLQKNL